MIKSLQASEYSFHTGSLKSAPITNRNRTTDKEFERKLEYTRKNDDKRVVRYALPHSSCCVLAGKGQDKQTCFATQTSGRWIERFVPSKHDKAHDSSCPHVNFSPVVLLRQYFRSDVTLSAHNRRVRNFRHTTGLAEVSHIFGVSAEKTEDHKSQVSADFLRLEL